MSPRASVRPRERRSEGFALILALLAMMLLTFLGLTLAVTSTTELQIATNYKWSQQAFFNAEAGIEIGKRLLQGADWGDILPEVRVDVGDTPTAENDRDYENSDCDTRGNIGYGRVVTLGANVFEDVSDVSTLFAAVPAEVDGIPTRLRGTFTLWVRRPLVPVDDGTFVDEPSNELLILTSEGTAPYTGPVPAFTAANRAVRTMEVRLSAQVLPPCSARSAQAGAGSGSAGFGACTGLTDESLSEELDYAASRGAAVGTGEQFTGE